MPNPDEFEQRNAPAEVFAALGDDTRLLLVERLSDGKAKSIMRLSQGLGLSRQGVTKHLRVLENAGLVQSHREGRESRFRFVPGRVRSASSYLERVAADWDEALLNLKTFVEGDQVLPDGNTGGSGAADSPPG